MQVLWGVATGNPKTFLPFKKKPRGIRIRVVALLYQAETCLVVSPYS